MVVPSLVEVVWHDAVSNEDWDDEILDFLVEVHSVGFLIKETDDFMVLAQSRDANKVAKDWAGQILIPKISIIEDTKILMEEA